MALTDHSDIYVAFLESGINRFARHVMRQRPSLFNYGTSILLQRPEMLCREIDVHPVVLLRNNPIIGVQPPLPIVGTPYGLDFALQFTTAELDFAPGNAIALPPELDPLGEQRFALHGGMCGGLGCPPQDLVDRLPPRPDDRRDDRPQDAPRDERDPILIPSDQLTCFCLDLFAVGDFDFVGLPFNPGLRGRLDGLELVDLTPVGLENSLECYAKLVVQLALLPRLADLPVLRLSQAIVGVATATIEPQATSAALPNNPAIEEDQLKVFVDTAFSPPPPPPPPGPPAPEPPPPVIGVEKPRTRTGPADATIAVAEQAVQELFVAVRNSFVKSTSGGGDFGPFSVSYAIGIRLENGSIDLRDDGTIRLEELDVVYDPAEVCLGIDIPEICVGGFCIIPNPFGGCLVRAPRICVFEDDPDIEFCLDLGGLLTSELTATLRPLMKYAIDPARLPTMNDWDAKDAGIPNKWQLFIDPEDIDIDLIDVADTVGNILDAAIEAAVEDLLFFLPEWAQDLILALLGPVVDAVRAILDIGDDLQEWLSDTLGVSLGLLDFVAQLIADYFAAGKPLVEIEDPFPVLDADGILIPVLMPLEHIGVVVNTDELILTLDIGN